MPSIKNSKLAKPLALVLAALVLSGCSADYLNRRDTITLAAGDAVEKNLHRETISPSEKYMYRTGQLGADGSVIPKPDAGSTTK